MKVRLLSSNNGVGLTRDAAILSRILQGAGHECWFTDWRSADKNGKADLNIYIELITSGTMHTARKNVMIPNPEWFEDYFIGSMQRCSAIFAKTMDCERIFSLMHRNVIRTGFTSEDLLDVNADRDLSFAHFAGQSNAKGTNQVIAAFKRAGMPKLYVYSITSRPEFAGITDNIKLRLGRQTDQEHRTAMNRHMVHICTSLYEGFGHYLNEAKSCRAVIITTNASPMNEMAPQDFAFGCKVAGYKLQKLARLSIPDVDSIEYFAKAIAEIDIGILMGLGEKARASYAEGQDKFQNKLIEAINLLTYEKPVVSKL